MEWKQSWIDGTCGLDTTNLSLWIKRWGGRGVAEALDFPALNFRRQSLR
jgi:hypothetical protein